MRLKNNTALFSLLCVMIGITAIMIAPAASSAGSFQNTFGGQANDYGLSVKQAADGGFIMAGWTDSTGHGSRDLYLVKTGPNGKLQWEKAIGGLLYDEGSSVVQASDGGYVAAGTSYSFGAGPSDIYLVKTDPQGSVLWQKSYGWEGAEEGRSVVETSDGGYAVMGYSPAPNAGLGQIVLVKADALGERVWQKTIGTGMGYAVEQTPDGGYIVAGFTVVEREAVFIVKIDSDGNVQWEKTLGAGKGFALALTSDGGYVVAGVTLPREGSIDAYLIKTDAKGELQWDRTFGGKDYDEASSVLQTPDGGYILSGWTGSSGAGYADVYLVKTDAGGKEQWTKTFGGKQDDEVYSLDLTTDGGYVMSGFTGSSGAGKFDAYMIRTDKSGN